MLDGVYQRTHQPCQNKAVQNRHADVQQILQMIFKVAAVKDQIIGEQPADHNQKCCYAPV